MTVHVLITGKSSTQSTYMYSNCTTGANSGIGYATAKLLTSLPNHHIFIACRNRSKGDATVQALQKTSISPISVSSLELDVDDAKSIQSAAETITSQFGHLDVLINNAGIYNPEEPLEAQLTSSFRTNVTGPALITEAFKPCLLKSPNPYLLHIGSVLGSLTFTAENEYRLKCTGYRASKAAQAMLSIEHAKELGPLGVKVFCIYPGLIESNLRGTDEKARTAGGRAEKPEAAARFIADVLSGKRDADVGEFIGRDGVWPW